MAEKTFPAQLNRLDNVIRFVEEELGKMGCPSNEISAIDVCLEEVFVNVAHYAYPDGVGVATVSVTPAEKDGISGVRVAISDRGQPFNPLERKDPDINAPAERRNIGGLGIYMVKKMMDEVSYDYSDGWNILTMVEYFE